MLQILKKLKIPLFKRNISTSGRLCSEELNVHRDSKDNNPSTPFDFSEANIKRLSAMIQNYPEGAQRSALSSAIDIAQRQIGWVPISAMHKIAEILSIPRMRVYEWATFYTMTKRKFRGKFNIKVCVTTPCMLRGSDCILQVVEQETCCTVGDVSNDGLFGVDIVQCQGACVNAPVVVYFFIAENKKKFRGKFNIKVCVTTPCMLRGSDCILQVVEQETCCTVGDVSNDGLFGVDIVQCQGACVNAPVVVVNDDYFEDVSVSDVQNIITCLRAGSIPQWGPLSGRFASEPITGLTTLLTPPPGPGYCIQEALFTQTSNPGNPSGSK